MRLRDKTAIVTGGASGFGLGIVEKFVAEGARVILADINADAARSAAAHTGTTPATADVSAPGDWQSLASLSTETFGGPPDIIVNNAGITHLPKPMETVDEDEFDRVLMVNCKSIYLSARTFAAPMKHRGSGAILNISSTAGLSPRPNLNWYNATKGWVNVATKTMAVELAPHGVRVNALNPVAGETPLLASFMGEDTPERRAAFLATIPLGRFSTPQDMGNAAAFLCSDEASMITGTLLEVDGGRCI